MPSEIEIIATRVEKHAQVNGGIYPLANLAFTIDHTLAHIRRAPPPVSLDPEQLDAKVTLHGRITNFRKSGGITFIKIADASGTIQLIASKAVLANYDSLHLMDLGDIIEIVGRQCLSKTNEPSVLIQEWTVLTKSHRAPPEKFFGLSDQELKYRKRYLDLLSSEETRARFAIRSNMTMLIRHFLDIRSFMEVETSTLNTISSGANAKPFTTHHNALDTDLFLRIAPELYLKRLLVGGYERIFEIGRNYRNEGISTRHNPEFTMLELYQAYGSFNELITLATSMIQYVDTTLPLGIPHYAIPYYEKWKAERTFTLDKFVEVPMFQAVMNACGKANISMSVGSYELFSCYSDMRDEIYSLTFNDLSNARLQKVDVKGMNAAFDKSSSTGEKVAALFEFLAEPFLTEDYRTEDNKYSLPVFITEYPKVTSPLARANDNNPSICDRYELFIDGRELANAFQELNDPVEQALRFQEQLENNDKDPMAFDADYIEALEYGLPPCIGFGMGIERAAMLFTGANNIKDVILFPTLRPLDNKK